jgi:hypothetical protein
LRMLSTNFNRAKNTRTKRTVVAPKLLQYN